jgi:hypothetical protein
VVKIDLTRPIESQMEALRMAVPDCPTHELILAPGPPRPSRNPMRYLAPPALLGIVLGLKARHSAKKNADD